MTNVRTAHFSTTKSGELSNQINNLFIEHPNLELVDIKYRSTIDDHYIYYSALVIYTFNTED